MSYVVNANDKSFAGRSLVCANCLAVVYCGYATLAFCAPISSARIRHLLANELFCHTGWQMNRCKTSANFMSVHRSDRLLTACEYVPTACSNSVDIYGIPHLVLRIDLSKSSINLSLFFWNIWS